MGWDTRRMGLAKVRVKMNDGEGLNSEKSGSEI